MKIGFDLRALQIGHQYRGIGQVVRRVLQEYAKRGDSHDFVFFQYDSKVDVAQDDLKITAGTTVLLPGTKQTKFTKYAAGGMSQAQEKIIRESCDVFVQFDFELGLPEGHKSVIIIHDQIPYLLGNKYPSSYHAGYKIARKSGFGAKEAAKKQIKRSQYRTQLVKVLQRASWVLTVSEYTRKTTNEFYDITGKSSVMHLGFDDKKSAGVSELTRLEKTRFKEIGLAKDNFLFFLGGVDERRRIDYLVQAFNQLRARGDKLHLVLGGYDFQSIDHIYNPSARRAIERSSYRDDIHLLGFVSNTERAWLYENALAFVFPSEFEGFGLPVIESLNDGCAVIAYNRTSVTELSGPNVYAIDTWNGIVDAVHKIKSLSPSQRQKTVQDGKKWASQFTWKQSARVLAECIDNLM
ncbi:glycosyltransferase family 4 protein [Candidatus Saccharibacteria bacterium]|nr:glycosyltransferase family 4 protein [Candidatus Saccharibacteria bacterium]